MKSLAAAFILLIGFSVAAVIAYDWLGPAPSPAPQHVVDRLCEFIRKEQQLDCVAVLADDRALKPGSIVQYDPPPGAPSSVPLPVSDLFDTCLVPGAGLAKQRRALDDPPAVSLPNFTYDIDHSLQAGMDVAVPQLDNMSFKAGPHWGDVSKIELANAGAWMATLDEIAAVDAYKSCEIRSSCADYIRKSKYRVVGTTEVARGLSYKVYDKSGDVLSLGGGVSAGKFKINVGAESSREGTLNATVQSSEPRVVGVRLLPADVFSGQQACGEPVAFSSSVSLSGTIVGGGGKGSIPQQTAEVSQFGETLSIAGEGSESSECNEGFERTRSNASVQARVTSPGPGSLDFSYRVLAQGGHYATVAKCVAGQWIGKTGHDTTATATAELRGKATIILRADFPPPLKIEFDRLPSGAALRLVDWAGRPLKTPRTATVNGDKTTVYDDIPKTIEGSGSFIVAPHGPGVYLFEATFRLAQTKTGGDGTKGVQSDSGTIRISLVQ